MVTKTFSKNNELMDGMEIALLSLERPSAKNNQTVRANFSGANNPPWVLRSGNDSIEEYTANKQPIGKFEHLHPFDMHSLELKSGDLVYLFTVVYADQFGQKPNGDIKPGGKKFKTKNLKQLLASSQSKSMKKQGEHLEDTLVSWMGELEQVR